MHRCWDSFIEPICRIVEPKSIIEVGAASGLNSANLLAYCSLAGGAFHAVDPSPNPGSFVTSPAFAARGTYHNLPSLQALPSLTADLILLDGDHNWYTVFHELTLIEATCLRLSGRLPVVLVHDIHWPYGRRDLYYHPDTIPPQFRQPHAQRGIVDGQPALAETGGYNYKHYNAIHEGGARNGVLTAVEDFLRETAQNWAFRQIPGFHGLGVLYPPHSLTSQQVSRLDALLTLPPHLRKHMETLEEERLYALLELSRTYWRLGGYPGPLLSKFVHLLRRITGRSG
jgi:hypothetical protein